MRLGDQFPVDPLRPLPTELSESRVRVSRGCVIAGYAVERAFGVASSSGGHVDRVAWPIPSGPRTPVHRPALAVHDADIQVGPEPAPRPIPCAVLRHRRNLAALTVDHRQPQARHGKDPAPHFERDGAMSSLDRAHRRLGQANPIRQLPLIEICETTHAPDIPSCGAVCGIKLPTWPGRALDSIIAIAAPFLVHRTLLPTAFPLILSVTTDILSWCSGGPGRPLVPRTISRHTGGRGVWE